MTVTEVVFTPIIKPPDVVAVVPPKAPEKEPFGARRAAWTEPAAKAMKIVVDRSIFFITHPLICPAIPDGLTGAELSVRPCVRITITIEIIYQAFSVTWRNDHVINGL